MTWCGIAVTTMTSPEPLVMPGTVHVRPPLIAIRTTPPDSTVHVVPVAGPQGATGPPGDSSTSLGYVHTQSSPVGAGQPVQVAHNLSFRPAGIVCKELDGRGIEYDAVAWVSTGILEVFFGVPFAGTISVS